MLAFVVARLPLVSRDASRRWLPPGEYYSRSNGGPGQHLWLAIHVVSVFGVCALGTLQFVPFIRKKYPACHRWCGRLYFLAAALAVASGIPLIPEAFGGELSARIATWTIGITFTTCGVCGLTRAAQRRIPEHHDWMVRMYAVGCSVVWARLFVPVLGINAACRMGLWGILSCGQIRFELQDDANDIAEHFSECNQPDVSSDRMVAVQASTVTRAHLIVGLRMAYSVGLWIGLLVHMLGVEVWLYRSRTTKAGIITTIAKEDGHEAEVQHLQCAQERNCRST